MVAEPLDFAHVVYSGERIGAVTWDGGIGVFEYSDDFVASGIDLSPIRMGLRRGIYRFPELSRTSFEGLPGLLSDSLPDRWGNSLLHIRAAQAGRSFESLNPVEKLCYVGRRGMGALAFEPPIDAAPEPTDLDIDWLADAAQMVVAQRGNLSTALDDEGVAELLRVGTSAGGARAKALIAWNEETNEVRSGQLDAPEGFEHWILKFDGAAANDPELGDPRGFGRVEFAYSAMARAAGIAMDRTELMVDRAGRAHFLTRRFDRRGDNPRVHMLTLSALGHYDFNESAAVGYEDAFSIAVRLEVGAGDLTELFRRMVFNVVSRNQDDHTKNISFLMAPDGRWRLSPAYDVMWAFNPEGRWTARHQMSIGGRVERFDRDDLLGVARRFGVKRAEVIIDDVIDAVSDWRTFASEADVEPAFTSHIASTHRLDI